MKYILKLALPVIIIIALAGLLITTMENPNPVVIVVAMTIVTIVLITRIRKIKKNAKKHYRNFAKSVSSNNSSSRNKYSNLTKEQAKAMQFDLDRIAKSFSGVEQLTSHADMRINVTSNGDGSFSIDYDIIRDGHEESYGPQVDSAAQVVINSLEWKLDDAVAGLKK